MKIEELKCPACGGSVRLDPYDPQKAVCEYCKSECIVETKQTRPAPKPAPPVPPLYAPLPRPQIVVEEQKNSSVPAVLAVSAVVVLFVGFLAIMASYSGSYTYTTNSNQTRQDHLVVGDAIYEDFISQVFGKPYDQVTEEVQTIQHLSIAKDMAGYVFEYSFDHPLDLGQELEQIVVTAEGYLKGSSLNQMTGLKSLHLDYERIAEGELEDLIALESFSSNAMDLQDIAAVIPNPGSLKKLVLGREIKSLAGIETFSNLQYLVLDGVGATDLSLLAANKELISLELIDCDEITDYSVLYVMTQLQELKIDSEGLKEIGFVEGMNELTSFGIEHSAAINLKPLEGKEGLQHLRVIDNYEMIDYHAINSLHGLKTLTIMKTTGKEDPDLSALTGLEYLKINGFSSVKFLSNLSALEELYLSSCNIDSMSAFSGLVNLKIFKCRSFWGEIPNLNFIASLPSLTDLDMTGVQLYGDISELFKMPVLETLILNGGEFELDFSKLQDNQVLKHLEMNGVKLYKNVKVESVGLISSIDYDRVIMDEHTDFLSHFTALESLAVKDNKLTQILFAANLSNLNVITIDNNYITDIRSLEHLEYLETISCEGNPVTSFDMLREDINIIREQEKTSGDR